MKKILILGASDLQLSGILAAKELGYYTIVADMNKNAPGKEHAHEFHEISTLDYPKLVELCKYRNVDGIYTMASDQPMNVVAMIGEELGLNTISAEAAKKTTNKGEMRKTLKLQNIETPGFFIVNDPLELEEYSFQLKYPCVMKPTNSSGSRGVVYIENKNNLYKEYSYAKEYSKDGEVIIEEFLSGKEYSVESISNKGSVKVIAITEKYTSGTPNFIETGHNIVNDMPNNIVKEIEKYVIEVLKELKVNVGPAHTEVILTKEGPRIVEVGPRLGGDYITSDLVPLSTGYNMVKDSIRIAMRDVIKEEKRIADTSVIRFFYTHDKGIYKGIQGIEAVEKSDYLKKIDCFKKVGEYIDGYQNSSDRIGYFILSGKNTNEVMFEADRLLKQIKVELEEETF